MDNNKYFLPDEKCYKGHIYETSFSNFPWKIIKFCIYGALGMVTEIFFTNIVRLFTLIPGLSSMVQGFTSMSFPKGVPENINLPILPMYVMTSSWLFFVYATGFLFIEWAYKKLSEKKLSIFLRAGIYMLIISGTEFLWGWFYRLVLGVFIWEYESFLITTSIIILPYWYIAAFIAETFVKTIIAKERVHSFAPQFDICISEIKENYEHIDADYKEYFN